MSRAVPQRWLEPLDRLQVAIERGGWRDLAALAASAAVVGIAAGLAGVYPLAFVAICGTLAVVAYRSSSAACVLVALSCPIVSLGAVELGFHTVPAYPLVAAGLLGVLRRGEWRQLRPGRTEVLLLAFLGVAVVVSAANVGRVPATHVVEAAGANSAELRWIAQCLALSGMVGLYVLMRAGIRSGGDVEAVVRALLVATGFVGAYALYQVLGRELDLPYTYVNQRRPASGLPAEARYIRVNGTLTEASTLAQFAAISLCLGVAWVVADLRRAVSLSRRGIVVVAAAGAGLVVLTLSKSAFAACAVWMPLLAVTLPAAQRRRRAAVAGLCAIAVLALVGFATSDSLARLTGQRGASAERYVRVGYWITAARMARENPFGVGVGNYPFHYSVYAPLTGKYEYDVTLTDAHNLFLEAIAETGALGGALFLAFVFSLVGRALSAARRRGDPFLTATTWGLAAAFAIGGTMHLTFSYFYFPFEWVLAGVLAALPRVADRILARTS